jgi:hypothetical protein
MGRGIIYTPFPSIDRGIKSGRMGYGACMGKIKNGYTPF